MGHDVFISHAAKDQIAGHVVRSTLETNGIGCWIAPRDVNPGTEWGDNIVRAIQQSRVMVLILTANASASLQIHREVEHAVSQGVAILPLRIEEIAPSKTLEYLIGNLRWLDAPPPLDAHLDELLRVVKTLLARK